MSRWLPRGLLACCVLVCSCNRTATNREGPAGAAVPGSSPRPDAPPPGGQRSFTDPRAGTRRSHVRGDFDGNGFADVLLSRTDGPPPSPVMEIFAADAHGIPAAPTAVRAAGDSCGMGAIPPTRVGDVNGDGFGDLAIPLPSRAGQVVIAFGSAAGLGASTATLSSPTTDVPSCFGQAVATGDVDGDGKMDLVVGAPLQNGEAGRVFVFRGTGAGFESAPSRTLQAPEGAGTRFGTALGVCDLDGDRHDDLIVGAPLVGDHRGRVYVFSGASGRELARHAVPDGPTDPKHAWSEFGGRVATVRGDGRCDAVVAAVGVSFRGLYLIRSGHADAAPIPLASTNGAVEDLATGDLDGDGKADLVISRDGFVQAYRGGPSGIDPAVWLTPAAPTGASDRWGASIAIPGDIDGDGREDLLVGDRANAFIHFGTATGVSTPAMMLPPGTAGGMGRADWVR